MTQAQARTFDQYSATNASTVENALNCGCKAYVDAYTYNRWLALGYQVQRKRLWPNGITSVRLPVVQITEREDADGNTEKQRATGWTTVFCRHLVKKASTNGKASQTRTKAKATATVRQTKPRRKITTQPQPQPNLVDTLMGTWKEIQHG